MPPFDFVPKPETFPVPLLKDAGIDRTHVTYGSLLTACERVGDVHGASRAFRYMKEDGMEPNEIIYGAAISCCRKAKDPDRALRLLKRMMQQQELQPNVACLNTVLIAQTERQRRQDSDTVVQLYKLMKSKLVGDQFLCCNRTTGVGGSLSEQDAVSGLHSGRRSVHSNCCCLRTDTTTVEACKVNADHARGWV